MVDSGVSGSGGAAGPGSVARADMVEAAAVVQSEGEQEDDVDGGGEGGGGSGNPVVRTTSRREAYAQVRVCVGGWGRERVTSY